LKIVVQYEAGLAPCFFVFDFRFFPTLASTAMQRSIFKSSVLSVCLLFTPLMVLPLGASAQTQPQASLATVKIKAGLHLITAEVAQEPRERAMGLMLRPTMEANHGMLFVFERADVHCFWMRNTLLPLSIAWLADDGSVVDIAEMPPQSDKSHCPKGPARFALEMNQGWFKSKGIKIGSKLSATGLFGQ
jgi:uncharacterized protein